MRMGGAGVRRPKGPRPLRKGGGRLRLPMVGPLPMRRGLGARPEMGPGALLMRDGRPDLHSPFDSQRELLVDNTRFKLVVVCLY